MLYYLFALICMIGLNLITSRACKESFSPQARRFGFCVGTLSGTAMVWAAMAMHHGILP